MPGLTPAGRSLSTTLSESHASVRSMFDYRPATWNVITFSTETRIDRDHRAALCISIRRTQ